MKLELGICIFLTLGISNIGWAATISPSQQTLMENVASLFAGLNFTAEAVISTTPSAGQQSYECSTINEAYGCLHSATLEVFGILLSPGFMSNLSDSRTSFCQAYGRYTSCSGPHLTGCPVLSTVLFRLIPGFFELLCSPAGYDQFINLLPCLTNYQFALQMEQCGQTIPSVVTEADLCSVPDGYTACLAQAAYTACSAQAEANLGVALGLVFQPFREAVCPNSTTSSSGLSNETNTGDMTLEEGSTAEEELPTTTLQHTTTSEQPTTTTSEEPTTTTSEQPTTITSEQPITTTSEEPTTTTSEQPTTTTSEQPTTTTSEQPTTTTSEEPTTTTSEEPTTTTSEEPTTTTSEEPTTTTSEQPKTTTSEEPTTTTSEEPTTTTSEEPTTTTSEEPTTTTSEEPTTTTSEEPTTATSEEPTTTTATTTPTSTHPPSPPYQCYECSSGAPGSWQNLACPANGKLKDWAKQTYTCHGPCITRITRWPLGDVVRSCSSNYYFTFPIPANGCRRENDNGIVCFCSGDRCNDSNVLSERAKLMKEFGQQ
ncbi:hypothetical protein Btru_071605 [Bulinus truncatus]|nr:hypothetical protein Btru_071605 [Bulinus truncatus]